MTKYADAHTHPENFSAAEPGLAAVALNAAREADWEQIMTLAELQNSAGVSVFPQLGIHPWYVDEAQPGWPERLERTLRTALEKQFPGVGVGEIGLDRLRAADETRWQRQLDAFRLQFRLACGLGLPVSVHCVRCWDVMQREIYGMLAPGTHSGKPAAIIFHNYLASPEIVGQLLTWERKDPRHPPCYFSFSPEVLAPNRQKAREAAKIVPRDRILAETDTHPERISDVFSALGEDCAENMIRAFCG